MIKVPRMNVQGWLFDDIYLQVMFVWLSYIMFFVDVAYYPYVYVRTLLYYSN